jgi:hypothetical protein
MKQQRKQEFILCMLLEMNLGEIGHSDSLIPLATTGVLHSGSDHNLKQGAILSPRN